MGRKVQRPPDEAAPFNGWMFARWLFDTDHKGRAVLFTTCAVIIFITANQTALNWATVSLLATNAVNLVRQLMNR